MKGKLLPGGLDPPCILIHFLRLMVCLELGGEQGIHVHIASVITDMIINIISAGNLAGESLSASVAQ